MLKDKEFKNEAQLEQFRSVMQMSTMAIKNAIEIDGAAAISLLTFLGNGNLIHLFHIWFARYSY